MNSSSLSRLVLVLAALAYLAAVPTAAAEAVLLCGLDAAAFAPVTVALDGDTDVQCTVVLRVLPVPIPGAGISARLHHPDGGSIVVPLSLARSGPLEGGIGWEERYDATIQNRDIVEGRNVFRVRYEAPVGGGQEWENVIRGVRPGRPESRSDLQEVFYGYILPLLGLAAIMIIIYVLYWVYAYAVGSRIDETTARGELVKYAVVAAVMVFLFVNGWDWIMGELLGIDRVYMEADAWLMKQQKDVLGLMVSVAALKAVVEMAVTAKGSAVVFSIQVGALLEPIEKMLDSVFQRLLLVEISFFIHVALLEFGRASGMRFFFPIGMGLRLVKGLERVGGLLMAMGIALYFAFPMIIVYIYQPIATSTGYLSGEPGGDADSAADEVGGVVSAESLADPFGLLDKLGELKRTLENTLEGIEDYVARLFVFWIVLPLLNMVLLIVVIAALTSFLGEREGGISVMLRKIFA